MFLVILDDFSPGFVKGFWSRWQYLSYEDEIPLSVMDHFIGLLFNVDLLHNRMFPDHVNILLQRKEGGIVVKKLVLQTGFKVFLIPLIRQKTADFGQL